MNVEQYIPFEQSAVVLGLFIVVYLLLTRRIRKPHTFVYLIMVSIIILSALGDAVAWRIEQEGRVADLVFTVHLCQMLYFIFHSLLGYITCVYIMMVNGSIQIRNRMFSILFSLPMALCEILILTNHLHYGIYYYTADGIYTRGGLEIFIYLVNGFYIIWALIDLIKYRNALPFASKAILFYFFAAATVGLVIQFYDQYLRVELFAEMMAFLGALIVIENAEMHRDPITNALSRASLTMDVNRMIETGLHFQLIAIRITNLDLYTRILSNDDMNGVLRAITDGLERQQGKPDVYYPKRGTFVVSYPTNEDIEERVLSIQNMLQNPIRYMDMSVEFEAVMAHVRVPENLRELDDVFRLLDSDFKKPGTGIQILSGKDFEFLQRRKDIEAVLRNCVEDHTLQVYYQPIWNVEGQRFSTAEALVRMITPELGFVSPAEFIPIAEENGLITEIGRFVFEETCKMYSDHHLELFGVDYIEVNLSLFQFLHSGLKDDFDRILKEQALTSDRINLEITESADLEQTEVFSQSMKELQEYGFEFSLDDFGTGFSNLSDAMKRNFKNIKMDISLLREADQDVNSRLLLSNLIWSFKSMGYHVIQEGVENSQQLEFVSRAGADLIQGFYFSKPLPKKDYLAFVQKNASN